MNVTKTLIIEESTGEIKSSGGIFFLDETRDHQIETALMPWGEGHILIEGEADPATQYAAPIGERWIMYQRPALPIVIEGNKKTIQAGGEDYTTLTGLPRPCTIIIDAPDATVPTQTYQIEDGGFIFEAETAGVYTIEVRRRPFLDYRVEIVAL